MLTGCQICEARALLSLTRSRFANLVRTVTTATTIRQPREQVPKRPPRQIGQAPTPQAVGAPRGRAGCGTAGRAQRG